MSTTAIAPRTAPATQPRAWTTRALAALAGLLAAALALASVTSSPGLFRNVQSPRDAVGAEFIDRTPPWLKEFAIEQFGTNDKVALRVGMLVVIGLLGLVLGALAYRRPWIGVAGFAAFGVFGGSRRGAATDGPRTRRAPADRRAASPASSRCSCCSIGCTHPRTVLDVREAIPKRASSIGCGERLGTTERKAAVDRRGFFMVSGIVAVGAAAAGGAGQLAEAALRRLGEPRQRRAPARAVAGARPLPSGAMVPVDGMTPFVTPNARLLPHRHRAHRAADHGGVLAPEGPRAWSTTSSSSRSTDLLRRRVVERDVTLTCVSNEVGGKLIGNARWLGVPLADVLEEAGVHDGADQLKSTSADGWTSGHAGRRDHRRPRRAARVRDERRAAPDRARLPRAHGRARSVRIRVGDEVGRRPRAHDVRRLRRVLGAAGLGASRRRSRPSRGSTSRSRSRGSTPDRSASRGVAWAQHRGIERRRSADRRRLVAACRPRPTERTIDTWRQWKCDVGRNRGQPQASKYVRRTGPETCSPRNASRRYLTARPGGTRSSSASADPPKLPIPQEERIRCSVTNRSRVARRCWSLALALSLTAAACGGDDDDDNASSCPTPTRASTTTDDR